MQPGELLEITVVNKESLLGVWVERGKGKSCWGLRGRGRGFARTELNFSAQEK